MADTLDIKWTGPFGWPKFEDKFEALPKISGVYLFTVEYQNGYLIYSAGITRRPMSNRFREHTREYMNGVYNVLGIAALKSGFRKVVWQGFWMSKRRSREQVNEFKKRHRIIQDAVRKQLAGFRIFVANIGNKPRILERLEAAIMENLYKQPMPLCDVPDKGMMLSPRWKSENPIIVKNFCSKSIFGLPACLEI